MTGVVERLKYAEMSWQAGEMRDNSRWLEQLSLYALNQSFPTVTFFLGESHLASGPETVTGEWILQVDAFQRTRAASLPKI